MTMQLAQTCEQMARRAKEASRLLAVETGHAKNAWLKASARALIDRSAEVLAANEHDVGAAVANKLAPSMVDRLRISSKTLADMAKGLDEVAGLPDPVGKVLYSSVRPNGLTVTKVSVPLGVIFFIYESRPNVTVDAAGLCVKSGNAVILRGGKEAARSNHAIYRILKDELRHAKLPEHAVQLVETTDREAIDRFLELASEIDVAIPRGGIDLIQRVVAKAKMPVLKHYQGICHVYVDASADPDMALGIIVNAKVQRPGVCNAAETLLVHEAIAKEFLPRAGETLRAKGVEIRGCTKTRSLVPGSVAATDADYATEHLALILSVKVVSDMDDAIAHITRFSSGHTEAIVTNDYAASRKFLARVDSSAVMVNASTRFTDGGELGLGAEIGISTDKFHARGPCGLSELCSTKYLVLGDGHVRE